MADGWWRMHLVWQVLCSFLSVRGHTELERKFGKLSCLKYPECMVVVILLLTAQEKSNHQSLTFILQ